MKLVLVAKYCARVVFALIDFIRHREELIGGITYFPEYLNRKKTKLSILFDQISHIVKYSYCNYFYFLYGFDIKQFRDEQEYVDYSVFMKQRNIMNAGGGGYSCVSVLRDKALFDIVASKYGFNTPLVLGLITDDMLFIDYLHNSSVEFVDYLRHNDIDAYLKVVDGECAEGVYHIVTKNGTILYSKENYTIEDFIDILPQNTRFILQQKMSCQHQALRAIHPNAVNTIRLVTVMDPESNKPVVFSAVLRVGVGKNEVDNWAAGGLSIGIDLNKHELKQYGFYKPGFGTKVTEHPDSHIVFEGYKIPYLGKAIFESLRFHGLLPKIHSIGWDIAITDNGPCFIEGNDNWEISLMQVCNHGLQKEFSRYFYSKL